MGDIHCDLMHSSSYSFYVQVECLCLKVNFIVKSQSMTRDVVQSTHSRKPKKESWEQTGLISDTHVQRNWLMGTMNWGREGVLIAKQAYFWVFLLGELCCIMKFSLTKYPLDLLIKYIADWYNFTIPAS